MSENVPLVNLKIQRDRILDEVQAGWQAVLENTSFIVGPAVDQFEADYARYCGASHCVGVGNGTDAIEYSLRALDIGHGDEVIAPANTFVATIGAIVRAGATPKLVDCDENFLINPALIAAAITERTKAVVPVHLYGQMAPMDEVIAAAGDLPVLEDAAQSQGASQAGKRSGSVGVLASTSFYPGKNLGAFGDAGAVTTSDAALDERLRRLRNHGGIAKYEHLEVGGNSRLDSLQAVVLSAKLKVLDDWNSERRIAAQRYEELLSGVDGVTLPHEVSGNVHVWHLYVVRVPNRDAVLKSLNNAGIGAGIHYPAPIHLLPAFSSMGLGKGSFPVAESLADEILSLPIYPGITAAQQERVAEELQNALKQAE